ncbi:hypothetical protein DRF65_05665 [Chryseobacterium pennae]|uniref:Uncharacterized protein n=1 Tax=Chryseobacterium pennae TaxID=2258962 RepID=A0A3D9CCS6_9FLAO|nr:hypothetical protein [Chryseobacterium pennae]REC63579.1 hypothetical protein DRF65_05665 [Chryseobacterium pennae]
MSRRIYFEITEETDWTQKINPDLGSIATLIFFANNLNPVMGEKMMNSTLSEYSYRVEKDLPRGNYTIDNSSAHYGPDHMEELIHFIDGQLIPSLQNSLQHKDIVTDIYGGVRNFLNLYYDGPVYLGYIGIDESNSIEGYTGYIPNLMQKTLELKNFYQRVKILNKTYEVFIE